jgi:DNA-binding NarL/FixJ family response regulator
MPTVLPPANPPIAVALVEDCAGLRESLAALLGGIPGFQWAGGFASAEIAIAEIPGRAPDVILMDIHLPRMSGIDCVRRLRELVPKARILMLTVFADPDHIFEALKAGASGYLSKRTPPADLLKAIADVHRGGAPMGADIAARIVEYFNRQGAAAARPDSDLTPREQEILRLLAQGAMYKEIAAHLDIAFDTVQWHIRHIYQKLHVRSRSEAIAKYLGGKCCG